MIPRNAGFRNKKYMSTSAFGDRMSSAYKIILHDVEVDPQKLKKIGEIHRERLRRKK